MSWQAFDETLSIATHEARGTTNYSKLSLKGMCVWIVQRDNEGKVTGASYGMGKPKMTKDPSDSSKRVWTLALKAASNATPLQPGPAVGFAVVWKWVGGAESWAQGADTWVKTPTGAGTTLTLKA